MKGVHFLQNANNWNYFFVISLLRGLISPLTNMAEKNFGRYFCRPGHIFGRFSKSSPGQILIFWNQFLFIFSWTNKITREQLSLDTAFAFMCEEPENTKNKLRKIIHPIKGYLLVGLCPHRWAHIYKKHCQRHYRPRGWLLWPVILVCFSMLGRLSLIWLAGLVW